MDCEQVRELAAELAIGIADGHERDEVMRHVETCPDCRRLISELSSVVDDLLVLTPSREPPPGFTSRAVSRISPSATRPVRANRRWLPRLAVAASIVAALFIGAIVVYQSTASDRQLASSYRAVLGQGHGSFFTAAPLRESSGAVGTVWGYQGQPPWLFATVHLRNSGAQRFDVQLITRDGEHLRAGTAVLGGTAATWGTQIPMDLTKVAQLRFVATSGQTTLVANLNARSPWGS